jgi:F-type H+-transporting ATPase subunit delta
MIAGSIARRYAKALLSLGVADRSQESMGRELDDLAQAVAKSAELREALQNPVFPHSLRRATLETLCARLGTTRLVRNFVLLVLERHRIGALPDMRREFHRLLDQHAGRIRARVTSARPLTPELEARLRTALEQRHAKKVLLEKRDDPRLIGGLVTEVGDIVYDGSVRYQLDTLRSQLLETK